CLFFCSVHAGDDLKATPFTLLQTLVNPFLVCNAERPRTASHCNIGGYPAYSFALLSRSPTNRLIDDISPSRPLIAFIFGAFCTFLLFFHNPNLPFPCHLWSDFHFEHVLLLLRPLLLAFFPFYL